MNVLVILGHPRLDSFSESLAEAYMDGARKAGVNITYLKLYELEFNVHVTKKHLRVAHEYWWMKIFQNDN